MASDVKLHDNKVTLEGEHSVDINAPDLVLEHPSRRTPGAGGYRRALVHDFQDGLTLNWAGDYPGGVVINGSVQVPDKLLLGRPEPAHEPGEREPNDFTRIDGLGNLDPGLEALKRLEHDRLFEVITQSTSPIDLAVELRRLRRAVVILYERLKQLEASTP